MAGQGLVKPEKWWVGGPVTERIQARLEEELERLKELFDLGRDLVVLWRPGTEPGVRGEVRGRAIIVHASEAEEAVDALIHEYLEFLLAQYYLGPALMASSGVMVGYARHGKEQLVDALAQLVRRVLEGPSKRRNAGRSRPGRPRE